jgi:hypothetical protein
MRLVGMLPSMSEPTRRRYLETRDAKLEAHVTPRELARFRRQAARVGMPLAEAVRIGTRLYLGVCVRDVEADAAEQKP